MLIVGHQLEFDVFLVSRKTKGQCLKLIAWVKTSLSSSFIREREREVETGFVRVKFEV